MSYSSGRDQQLFLLGRVQSYLKGGDLLNTFYEIETSSELLSEFEASVKNVDGFVQSFDSILQFRFYRMFLYCILRHCQPETVIETGVLHGMTSAFLLEALHRNGTGKLVSIDLPSYFDSGPANEDGIFAVLPANKEPGWFIPERLRSNWSCHLGSSRDLLVSLYPERAASIDFFIHDSDHCYENMWFELNYVWPRLKQGGVLVCDNINMNTAFFDFCNKFNLQPLVLCAPDLDVNVEPRFALVVKP